MNLKESIKSRMKEFLFLCSSHKIKTIHAFGSSVNDNFNEKSSDIDLLIDLEYDDPLEKGANLLNIWDELEIFFDRKVDLLTYNSIKNPILKKNIDSSKILIYDGRNQKIFI